MPIQKEYVAVTAMHYASGLCVPVVVEVYGIPYLIEGIHGHQHITPSFNEGAQEKYTIVVRRQERELFREANRWFLLPKKKKNSPPPRS